MIGDVVTYENNLPGQPYVIDPTTFAQLSNNFRKSYPGIAFPGFGTQNKVTQAIDKYGIVSTVHVFFDGTLTWDGVATPVPTSGYPWRLISEARVSANGISNLFDCDGVDLRALARVRRGRSLADESVFALPTNATVQPLRLHWEIPLAIDEVANLGAVLAQTDDNNLSVRLTMANSTDLFSAHAPAVAGTFYFLVSAYEIPEDGKGNLVIPDLRQMHGVVTRDDNLVATGQMVTPLTKTGGLLLRTLQRIDNAPPNYGSADWLTDAVTEHFFRYNAKEIPHDYEPAWMLRFLNDDAYAQATLPASDVPAAETPPAYLVDDYVNVLAMRDVVNMAAVSQPEIVNVIAGTYALNAGAKVHTVQEAMLTG